MKKTTLLLTLLLVAIISLFYYLPNSEKKNATPQLPIEEEPEMASEESRELIQMSQVQKLKVIAQLKQRAESGSADMDIEWKEKGPTNIGGRTRTFLIDKRDPTENTLFAAGVSGGLWKTTNFQKVGKLVFGTPFRKEGTTWESIPFDFPNLAICALVQDPNNLEVLYAGTGEFWSGFHKVVGAGIWKSIDGGNHWEHLASTANNQFEFVNRLVFDQYSNLYAATATAGLLKSTDGGDSWTVVMDKTIGSLSNIAADIDIAANGDLYASFGGKFEADHIYKSSAGENVGNVGNWLKIELPGTFHRKEIACAPTDAMRVYVLVSFENVMTNFLISENGGSTWTKVAFKDLRDSQANYDMTVAVSNEDADIVLAGGIGLFKSKNGGVDWLSYGFGPDNHFLLFGKAHPDFPERAYVANDWGMAQIWNNPRPWLTPISFERKNESYRTSQVYGLAVHPEIASNEIIAGSQDTGSFFFDEPEEEQVHLIGGDNGFPYIDQNEPQFRIITGKHNIFQVNTNGQGNTPGQRRTISLDSDADFIGTNDYDDIDNILYAGSYKNAFFRIKDVFKDFPIKEYVAFNGLSSTHGSSVDVSPNDNKKVYFGQLAKLYRVNNAQEGLSVDAELIFEKAQASSYRMRNIVVEKGNEDHILLCMLKKGDEVNIDYLWETKNSSNNTPSWESFQGDLPKMPVWWIIFLPGENDKAMVGTEFGLWITDNIDGANTHWQQCKNGIPNVRVTHLVHRESDDRIVAATYGRGVFYTQSFEEKYAFFTNDKLQIKEADIYNESNCRSDLEIDIPIELSKRPDSEVTLTINVNEQETTLKEGQDYEFIGSNSFSFNSDAELQQNFKIRFYDDAVVEEKEQLSLEVTSSDPSIIISRPNFLIEVEDDDMPINLIDQSSDVWLEDWVNSGLKSYASTVEHLQIWKSRPLFIDFLSSRTPTNFWQAVAFCDDHLINSFTAQVRRLDDGRTLCGYMDWVASDVNMFREVDARGIKNIQVDFDWICVGKPDEDYATLIYSKDLINPNWKELPKQYVDQVNVLHEQVILPAELNDSQFFIGWRWQNAGNGTGEIETGFSLDNVEITGTLTPTKAEIENFTISKYIGEGGDVLFFSERKRMMSKITNNTEGNPMCTIVDLKSLEGNAVSLETEKYTGFYLPISFDISYENESSNALDIALFFEPSMLNSFLSETEVSEDSLFIYFLEDGDFNKITKIASRQFSNIAAAKQVSFSATAQNGIYLLAWLEEVPCIEITTQLQKEICFGGSFEGYSSTGVYTDVFQTDKGCDSTRVLNLTISTHLETNISESICEGDVYVFDNQRISIAGTYQQTVTSTNGCDSTTTLVLTISSHLETNLSESICEGDSYDFSGGKIGIAGNYQQTVTSTNGCDSVIKLTLSVFPKKLTNLSETICQGDVFVFDGQELVVPDIYRAEKETINGCDSVIILNLKVSPLPVVDLGIDKTITNQEQLVLVTSGTFQTYQWSDGSSNTSLTINGSELGAGTYEFSLTVTDDLGCTAIDNITITIEAANSINEVEAQLALQVYPNPFQNKFSIAFQLQNSTDMEVHLFNLNGEMKKKITTGAHYLQGKHRIDFENNNLPSGIYYIVITLEERVVVRKIVLQR